MTCFYQTCCMCGPRAIAAEDIAPLLLSLDRELGWLISQDTALFRVCLRPGFDTFSALTVINHKRLNPYVELEVIDCGGSSEPEVREFILAHADRITEMKGSPRSAVAEYLTGGCTCLLRAKGESNSNADFTVEVCELAHSHGLVIVGAK